MNQFVSYFRYDENATRIHVKGNLPPCGPSKPPRPPNPPRGSNPPLFPNPPGKYSKLRYTVYGIIYCGSRSGTYGNLQVIPDSKEPQLLKCAYIIEWLIQLFKLGNKVCTAILVCMKDKFDQLPFPLATAELIGDYYNKRQHTGNYFWKCMNDQIDPCANTLAIRLFVS